jgi:hypothetical protein
MLSGQLDLRGAHVSSPALLKRLDEVLDQEWLKIKVSVETVETVEMS